MIAAEEMERLRVRLADLPGFDPVGLLLARVSPDGLRPVVIGVSDVGQALYVMGDQWAPLFSVDPDPTLSTADARTRDALARWVAERVKVTCRATAPEWRAAEDWSGKVLVRTGWCLHGYGGAWFWPVSGALTGTHQFVVPALAGLDPNDIGDDRRLPDGSRWVDAAALAAVTRHVGGAK